MDVKFIYKVARADFDTPLSIFIKVGGELLLESVVNGESLGRYSIIGIGQRIRLKFNADDLLIEYLKQGKVVEKENYKNINPMKEIQKFFKNFKADFIEDLPAFYAGAIGYLGYETIACLEDIPVDNNLTALPDGFLIVPETVIVYDSISRLIYIVVPVYEADFSITEEEAQQLIHDLNDKLYSNIPSSAHQHREYKSEFMGSNLTRKDFIEIVNKAKEHIEKGDIIQVVLSQKFKIKTNINPFELYRILRIVNPSPYLFYLDMGDFQLIGSSPEVMVKLTEKKILLKPIAGTRPRGRYLEEDKLNALDLISDPKELAEHLMLVDLGRNDLGRVAVPGSVDVVDYMSIENYSHVMHIVSSIAAELKPGLDAFDLLSAVFPAGTLSGAPKIRAMELIAELEPERRGPYGGTVMYYGFNGNLDSCITIRTIVLKDGEAEIQAGAGIVYDSVPEKEFEETENKGKAMIKSIMEGF